MSSMIEDLDDASLTSVISFVHRTTGITLPSHKKTMIQRRLLPRLREHSLSSYKEYLKLVRDDKDELKQFINMVTTNETNFFRTDRVWEYFENTYLNSFLESSPNQKLHIWSAAASTGEEGYSLAMSCDEFNKKNCSSIDYQILGTDISSDVIDHANTGIYQGRNIDNLRIKNSSRLKKYFTPISQNFSISNHLKSKISFKIHNLFEELENSDPFDIVFLRNVLIYFSVMDQEKVIHNIEKKMKPNGILIIGEAESLSCLKTNLEFISPLVYRKIA